MSVSAESMTCVVCGGSRLETLVAAAGKRVYCHDCFHGWRIEQRPYAYSQIAMCALGTSVERLGSQVRFFQPFAKPGADILEIGCATGELASATRRDLKPNSYDAIELSPAGAHARAIVDTLFDVPLGDLLKTKALTRQYDMIIMSHVLEHIEDPAAELQAMAQVLKPGGVIFLEVPNGAGHRRLPIDDNSSHLHFFSATSLTRLLASQGLETIAAATDVRLDARYADSLQVMARAFRAPSWNPHFLSDHPALAGADEIIIWGAGSLAEEMLANFFDPARISFFVDRDTRKQGGTCLGRPVRDPSALIGKEPVTILANSIDYGPAIATDVAALYPGAGHRIVQMSDLLVLP